jgi:hypothetical protein
VILFFKARFTDVALEERWGYAVWGAMGVMVGVPEITAALRGRTFIWPTISTTIGHLESYTSVVALIPVAIIVMGAYSILIVRRDDLLLPKLPPPSGEGPPFAYTAISRNKYGRVMRRSADYSEEKFAEPWPVPPPLVSADRYFTAATLLIVVSTILAAQTHNRWLIAYVLYSLIGVFWIVIPALASWGWQHDVPFLTLFFTLRWLEQRLHLVAYVIAAALAILALHLAFYPWPDLSRVSSKYAGNTPGNAQEKAEQAVSHARPGKPRLELEAADRHAVNERQAWIFFFRNSDGTRSGCRVVISYSTTWTSPICSSAP